MKRMEEGLGDGVEVCRLVLNIVQNLVQNPWSVSLTGFVLILIIKLLQGIVICPALGVLGCSHLIRSCDARLAAAGGDHIVKIAIA